MVVTTNKELVAILGKADMVPSTVAVVGANSGSYQIKGKLVKAIVSTPSFRKYYEQIREKTGDADLIL